jgi:hypothetical protein
MQTRSGRSSAALCRPGYWIPAVGLIPPHGGVWRAASRVLSYNPDTGVGLHRMDGTASRWIRGLLGAKPSRVRRSNKPTLVVNTCLQDCPLQ